MTKAPPKKTTQTQKTSSRFPERPAEAGWWVSALDEHGKKQWFLRFLVTGLYPRRFGPFDTQAEGLEFLRTLLGEVESAIFQAEEELPNCYCTIREDELASAYLKQKEG